MKVRSYGLLGGMKFSLSYNWSGNQRKRRRGNIFFNTRFSKYGMIEIDGQEYKVDAGKAFIVNIPGNYRYYLPKGKVKTGEFIFLTLYGDEVTKKCGDYIQSTHSLVIRFHPESAPVQLLAQIYKRASEKHIADRL